MIVSVTNQNLLDYVKTNIIQLFNFVIIYRNHWNYTKIEDLSKSDQQLLQNLTMIEPFIRTIALESSLKSTNNSKYIKLDSVFSAYEGTSISITLSNNITYKTWPIYLTCKEGQQNLNYKCRSWFQGVLAAESISINKPALYLRSVVPYLNQALCQKMFIFDQSTNKDIINHYQCVNAKLESFNNYFQNYAKSTVQAYLIEPFSQIVLFDSRQQYDKFSTKTLSELELNYLESKSEAQMFNDTLKQTFKTQLYEKLQKIDKKDSVSLDMFDLEFEYIRNGTKNQVIINPIYLIDKLPQYVGVKDPLPKGYNIHFMLAQINIISNQFLEQSSYELLQFFNQYYFIYIINFIGVAIISLICAMVYSVKITRLFNGSINHLIDILNKIQKEQKNELHEFITNIKDSNIQFLSLETKDLFESFKSVFQILLYTSENFFSDNQTETLLKLHSKIEFFKQFRNDYAVGISHNNIGNILLQQGHYFESLEHFQTSIMFAKYEIQSFLIKNPFSSSSKLMFEYSFQNVQQKQNRISIQVKPLITNYNKQKLYKFKHQNSKLYKNEVNTLLTGSELDQKKPQQLFTEKNNEQQNSSYLENIIEKQFDNHKFVKSTNNTECQLNNKNLSQTQNNLQTLDSKYTQQFEQMKTEQGDDYPEERVKLMSSLFHRQQNFITALIAFQEDHDKQQQQKNISQILCNGYNFWKEIKNLLKNQISLCQFFDHGQNEKVEILALISKCQFNLNQMLKSHSTLRISEKLLNNLQSTIDQYSANDQNEQLFTNDRNDTWIAKQTQTKVLNFTKYDQQDDINQLNNSFRLKQKQVQFPQPKIIKNLNQLNSNNHLKTTNNSTYNDNSCQNIQFEQIILKDQQPSQQIIKQTSQFNSTINQQNNNSTFSYNNQFLRPKKSSIKNQYIVQISQADDNNDDLCLQKQNYTFNQLEDIDKVQVNEFSKQVDSPIISFAQKQQESRQKSQPIGNAQNFSQAMRKKKSSISTPKISKINSFYEQNQQQKYSEQSQQLQSNHSNRFKAKSKINNQLSYYQYRKDIQNKKHEEDMFNNQNILDQKSLFINYIKSEYFMKLKNYHESALTLTSLFENYKVVMSHFPFKITSLLNQIFNICDVKSKDFDEFNLKFNQNIQMNIVMIYAYQKEYISTYQQSIILFKNLVNFILTSQKDKIALMIYNQEEDILQFYMNLMQIPQIYQLLDQITFDINEAINGQQLDYYQFDNKTSYKQSGNKDIKSTQNDNTMLLSQFSDNQILKSNELNNKSVLHKNSMNSDALHNESIFQHSFIQTNNTQQINQNEITDINECSDYLLDTRNNTSTMTYRFIQQKTLEKHLFDDSPISLRQLNQHMGDELGEYSQKESYLDRLSKQLDIEKQNEIFYESIRQALDKCFIKQIVIKNSKIRHYLQQYCKNTKNKLKSFDFQQLLVLSSDLKDQQQKYIIFATNEINITNDITFEKMCQILYYLNVQLLILSDEKVNNFLKQYTDEGYQYEERVIIKVFRERSKIINYLNFQRDSTSKNIYPTFIQHY